MNGTIPTADQLHGRNLDPRLLAACLLLIEHGIDTDEVPLRPDALTAEGYLHVDTPARVDPGTNEILADRVPWPDLTVWNALQPLLPDVLDAIANR